ncbi:hypothetical protein QJS10_CPA06g02191 [Acorus calamus]|uniref:Uncharacterized protein n=1 Tax=Acorus calamus TaxID=4465 RepID=A0AAV9EK69_ACOCL|nr:hypothetical protein QJS10_CPA06g02191 [Acorus calamus]
MNDALNEEATRDSEEHDFHKPSDSLPLDDPKDEYRSDHHVESNRGALLQVDELNDAQHEELRDGGGHDLHKSSGSMPAENLKEELNSECHHVESNTGTTMSGEGDRDHLQDSSSLPLKDSKEMVDRV